MKKLNMALAAAFALVLLSSLELRAVGQMKKKAQPSPPMTPQVLNAIDPLSSFKGIVKKFETFFVAGPEKLVMAWPAEDNTPQRFLLIGFAGQDIAYDVKKTESLVSPYTAQIDMKVIGKTNASCGDMKGVAQGWSTAGGAMAASAKSECYKDWPLAGTTAIYGVRFVFAYQDGKWVFTDALDTTYGGTFDIFLSIFGKPSSVTTTFTNPEAEALNAAWRGLLTQ